MFYSNLQDFVNKFRHLFFVLISLAVIVCIYALLSFVFVGRTDAVPLKWQKHLEISQQELYKNLDNFSIVGVDKNVLRSDVSDNSSIIVDLGNRATKDYKRVSLLISRLNTTNSRFRAAWLSFVDKSGRQTNRTFGMLRDGFNSSKAVKGNIPEQFTITLSSEKSGFSMEVERAYLSKYSVLPNKFIPPFIILSLFAVAISWCCFYKGLHRWVLAKNWALFAIIVAIQLMFVAYYRDQAKGNIGEEMSIIVTANRAETIFALIPNTVDRVYNDFGAGSVWHSSQDLFNSVTAQPNEGLSHLNRLRARQPEHSITHYIQLHLASMLFPNTFSYWLGVLLNIPYYLGTCILLYVISRRFLSGRLALLPLVFYGFSAAGIYTPTFARSYMLSAFFCVLSIYLLLNMLDGSRLTKRFYLLLALTFFLGFDAHNYFLLWFAGISVVPVVLLFYRKRFMDIAKCAVALVASFTAYMLFAVHSFAISHAVTYYSISTHLKRFSEAFTLIANGFGAIFWCIFVIAVIGFLFYNKAKIYVYSDVSEPEHSFSQQPLALQGLAVQLCVSMAIGIFAYILANVLISDYPSTPIWRYLAISPAIALLLILFINELISRVVYDIPLYRQLFAGMVLIISFIGFYNRVEPIKITGYYERANYAKIAEPYRDIAAICISYTDNRILAIMNLREAISIKPDSIAELDKALEHVKDDKSVVVYFGADTGWEPKWAEYRQFIIDAMHQRGYTKRVPFIDGVSWIFSK
ncbi:hypothetical protein RsTz2092_10340 [Deferribacterales bacterium RsTz2092]|nr:hypothetical protein AGMMS49941_08520 [Deferribacterales bacterium]